MQVTYDNALDVWEQIKNVVPEDTAKSFGPVLNPMVWNEYGKNEEITSLIETLIHEINENLELNNISLEEKKSKTKKVNGREFVITKTANRIKGGKGGKKQVAIKFEDKVVDIPKFTYKNAINLWGDFRIKRHIMDNLNFSVDFQNQLESLMAHSWDKYGKNIIVTKAIDSKIKKINDALGYKNTRIKSGKARKKQVITEAEDGIISNLEIEKMVNKAIEETKKAKTKKVGNKEITIKKTANRLKNVKVTATTKTVNYTLSNIYLNTHNKIGYSEVVQYTLDYDQNENHKKYNLKRHYDEVHISRELHFDNPNFILNSWDSDYSPYINKKCSGGNIYFEDKELKELLKRNGIPTEDQKIVSFIYNETQFKFNQKIEECKKYQYLPFRSTHVNCIAVFCKGDLIMVIDPQGYSYARYMYLPTIHTKKNTTKTYDWWMQNFDEYKEKMIVDDFTGKKTEANYPIEDIVMLDENGNYINKKAKTIKVGGKEITIKKTGNRVKASKGRKKSNESKIIDFKPGVEKPTKKTSKKAKTPKAKKVAKPSYKKAPYWYQILQKFKNMAGKEHKTTSSIQAFLTFLQDSCNSKLNRTTPHIETIRKIQDVVFPYANRLDKTYQDLPKWESLVNECKEAMSTITISKKTGVDPKFETVTLSGHKSKSKKKSKKCK